MAPFTLDAKRRHSGGSRNPDLDPGFRDCVITQKVRHSRAGGNLQTLFFKAITPLIKIVDPCLRRDDDEGILRHSLFRWGDVFLAVICVIVFSTHSNANSEKVEIKTKDGLRLPAIYLAPLDNNPTVIMLHGLESDKNEWRKLFHPLEKTKWGYLAFDMRGKGRARPTQLIDDVGAAVRFIKEKQSNKKPEIFMAGASLGANVGLNFAIFSRSVRGVILLSPGENYMNVKTIPQIQNAKKFHVLIVASPKDPYAYNSSLKLKKLAPQITLWTDVKPGHGVQMFDKLLIQRLIQWLKNHQITQP